MRVGRGGTAVDWGGECAVSGCVGEPGAGGTADESAACEDTGDTGDDDGNGIGVWRQRFWNIDDRGVRLDRGASSRIRIRSVGVWTAPHGGGGGVWCECVWRQARNDGGIRTARVDDGFTTGHHGIRTTHDGVWTARRPRAGRVRSVRVWTDGEACVGFWSGFGVWVGAGGRVWDECVWGETGGGCARDISIRNGAHDISVRNGRINIAIRGGTHLGIQHHLGIRTTRTSSSRNRQRIRPKRIRHHGRGIAACPSSSADGRNRRIRAKHVWETRYLCIRR